MTIKYLYPALPESDHQLIKNWTDNLALKKDELIWDEKFNRHSYHNPAVIQKYHTLLEPLMSEYFGRPVKKSYCYIGFYGSSGICKKHTDRIQCQFTYDFCVSQDIPLPIYVEDNEITHKFVPEENSAIIYQGTEHPHWRDDRSQGDHCTMIFFHFVPADFSGDLL